MTRLSGGFAADRLELWFDAAPDGRRADQSGVQVGLEGTIVNLVELASTVRLPRGDTPTVLARAWSLWDEGMLKRLRGSFIVCVWDSGRARGIIAVDELGSRTVYYRALGPRLRFAGDLSTLLDVLSGTSGRRSAASTAEVPTSDPLPTGVEKVAGDRFLRLSRKGWESVGR